MVRAGMFIINIIKLECYSTFWILVQSGAAWVYDKHNSDNSLPASQRAAQEQKRGLWAESNPMPPWEWRHNK